MGFLDKALAAPGKLVGGVVEVAASLPAVALDVAEKAVEGAEKGIDRVGDVGKDKDKR